MMETETVYSYADLRNEFRLAEDGDAWGSVMHWWFSVAEEIYFNRDFAVPTDWRFRPSPLGPTNDPDDYASFAVRQATDEALQKFGALLVRYASKLKHAGKDY